MAIDLLGDHGTAVADEVGDVLERGLKLAQFREEITIRMPTPDELRGLQLGPGFPVAELHRIAYSKERPIEVFRSIMAGNSHVFAYEFDAPE